MKNIIRLITIIILIAVQFSSYGQLKRANQYFDLYRYAKAIPLYQKVINNGSEVKRNEAIVKIADCYRLINNPQEARSWYSRAVENQAAAPVNYLYLGQAWCELENYTEAKTAFEKYSQLVPDDPKGSLYAGFCDWANENKNAVSSGTEIKNEEALNTQWSDFSPVIYKDGIVFTSDRVSDSKTDLPYKWTDNDYLDLYVSKPKYYKDFWTDMTLPKTLSNSYEQLYHDGPAVFSKDGSMVVISRTDRKKVHSSKDKIKIHMVKLFYADVVTGKEPKFNDFFLNSDDYSVAHPALSADAKTMVFSSDKPGGRGESDLYMCKWENDAWTNVVSLGDKINTAGNEVFPCLVNDTVLLFASDGHAGFGGLDIFISYKKGDEWSESKNLMKPINSSYDDFGILMFNDLKSGYFSSNRPEGVGLDDIYAFRNLGAAISEKVTASEIVKASEKEVAVVVDTANMAIITGLVKDKTTQQPIAGATVFLFNPQNSKVKIMKTNADGQYKTTVDRPAEYLVKAMQKNNIADCLPWDIAVIEAGKTITAPRDLLLNKLDVNKSFVLKNIYYDRDKSDIREDAKPDLNKVIRIMQENPYIIAEIASHTDSRSSFEYNNMLSQNRANAAVDYIVMNGGILPGRILARGYGEYKLTNRCKDDVPCTEAEHQLNRRTEFKVIAVSQPSGRGQFDPSKFTEGEIISSKNLPDFFFEPCQLKISDSPAEVAATQQQVATPVSQTATPVKQTVTPVMQTTTAVTQTTTPQNETTKATVPAYHIVVLGETLYHISITNNTTVDKLKELNNLSNNTIIVGQKLRLN